MDLSVIIPVHNEQDNVPLLAEWIFASLTPTGMEYEVIFVDDGSTDATLSRLQRLVAQHARVRAIRLHANIGQTGAMQLGIRHARGAIVVTMDGDLQNDPGDIPRLAASIAGGNDFVAGWRKERQDHFFSRRLPSRIANWCLARFLGLPTHDLGCTLKAFRSELVQRIPLYSDLHRFIPAVCMLATTRIDELEVRHHPRRHGTSKYGLLRTGKVLLDALSVKLMLSGSRRPLHFFGLCAAPAILIACATGVTALLFTFQADRQLNIVMAGASMLSAYLGLHLLFTGLFAEFAIQTDRRGEISPLVDVVAMPRREDLGEGF